MQFLATQLYNFLVWFYDIIPNLGLEIILVTIIIKAIILAFTWKSLKQNKKMTVMNEELKELTKKYKNDAAKLQAKQIELQKKYNVNPLSGCIPQILQLLFLIVFYQAISKFIGAPINSAGQPIDTIFLGWDLARTPWEMKQWIYYIIPVLAGGLQLLLSFMISPGAQVRDVVPDNSKNKIVQAANTQEENQAQMASTMQRQMMFMMPIMTGFICFSLPVGTALYWIVSTIFGIFQQAALSGWGPLKKLAFWRKTEIVDEKNN